MQNHACDATECARLVLERCEYSQSLSIPMKIRSGQLINNLYMHA
jgi:hypothetical protein